MVARRKGLRGLEPALQSEVLGRVNLLDIEHLLELDREVMNTAMLATSLATA